MRPLKISAAVLCWLLIILAILFTVLDIQLSPESGAQQRFLRFYSDRQSTHILGKIHW